MSFALAIALALATSGCGADTDPSSVLVFWGDSLTEGAGASSASNRVPNKVASLMGSRSFVNKGQGGNSSSAIAARMAAIPVTVTLTGNAIPASSSVVLTSVSPPLLDGSATRLAEVTIAGVFGMLTRDNGPPATSYEFRREVNGSSVSVPSGSALVAHTAQLPFGVTVIWSGRNDTLDTSGAATALANIQAMVAAIRSPTKKYLVLSVLNGASEGTGTTQHDQIVAFNSTLSTTFGANYLDVRALLTDGTDTVSATYRVDAIHLNDTGYGIVATAVANKLTALGY